jgi:hypothetical protein
MPLRFTPNLLHRLLQRSRVSPAGRASTSQEVTSTPLGPNHRLRCSVFVHASKTSSRGALVRTLMSSPR